MLCSGKNRPTGNYVQENQSSVTDLGGEPASGDLKDQVTKHVHCSVSPLDHHFPCLTPQTQIQHNSATSPLGHLYLKETKFGLGKTFTQSRLKTESLKTERMRALQAGEARELRARKTLTPRFTDCFTDFEKKPTVLQS